ncbi:hypothetical protein ACFT8W_00090 [Streptomyces hygroscopicus]
MSASMWCSPDGLPEVAAQTGEVLAGVKPGRENAGVISEMGGQRR